MRAFALLSTLMLMLVAPVAAHAQQEAGTQTTGSTTDAQTAGGTEYGTDPAAPPRVLVPGTMAKLMDNGFAAAPADAPVEVQEAVFAANEIVGKPYVYGGGHRSFKASGYDCSGTVSYALHGGGLLRLPAGLRPASCAGASVASGAWITVYTNPGHAFAVIAGLRLDTSAAGERVSSGKGPRWRGVLRRTRGIARGIRWGSKTLSAGRLCSRPPLSGAVAEDLLALGEAVAAARLRLALAPVLGVGLDDEARDLAGPAVRRRGRPS